jgi:glutaredoxin 3
VPENVVIYRTRFCPYCELAARFLRDKSIPFTEIDVSSDRAKRLWLLQATRRRTVPQIFINGHPIGGFVDLVDLDRVGKLTEALLRSEPVSSKPEERD